MVKRRTPNSIADISAPTDAMDASGRSSRQYVTVCLDLPCSIRKLNGRELEVARMTEAASTHQIQFYWHGDHMERPTAKMRAWDKSTGRTFEFLETPDCSDERDPTTTPRWRG